MNLPFFNEINYIDLVGIVEKQGFRFHNACYSQTISHSFWTFLPEIQHPPPFCLIEDQPRPDVSAVGSQGAVIFRGRYPGVSFFPLGMYHDIPDDLHLSIFIFQFNHQRDYFPFTCAPTFASNFFLNSADDSGVPIVGICPYPKCHKISSF